MSYLTNSILIIFILFIVACTKDSSITSSNNYRAFTVCLEEENEVNYADSIVVGTVPNGKQWVIVSFSLGNPAILIDNGPRILVNTMSQSNGLPIYIDEGQTLVFYGEYEEANDRLYTSCISINEYDVN